MVMSRPAGSVTLCCLAPLTNIALAFEREPRLAQHLAGIVLMGGAMSEGGNISPAAEFNFFVDPEAASRVFSSGIAITMIPLDCTHQALLTDARLEVLRTMGTAVGTAFYHLMEFNKRFDRAKYGWPGGPLHDATVTAYLLKPELFTGRKVFVDIERSSPLTLGASVVDWWGVTGKPPNALVLRTIDADGYFHLIFDRLSRFQSKP
jgi:purine nucleosidase